MRKSIIALILLCCTLLSSCSANRIFEVFESHGDSWTNENARLEQIIEAINAQDKEALSALFSKAAVEEAEDLDGRMDYLLSLSMGKLNRGKNLPVTAVKRLSKEIFGLRHDIGTIFTPRTRNIGRSSWNM